MSSIKQPLSNLQLELLKAFSHQLDHQDLLELKAMLAAFFAKKSIEEANKIWDQEGWDQQEIEKLLHTKLRTPYKNH